MNCDTGNKWPTLRRVQMGWSSRTILAIAGNVVSDSFSATASAAYLRYIYGLFLFKIAMWTMERHPGNHRLKSALLRLVSKKFGKAEIWEKLALVQVKGKFLPYAACKDWDKPVDPPPPIKKQVIWCCIVPMSPIQRRPCCNTLC